jgi:alpha-L-rhamnosidase
VEWKQISAFLAWQDFQATGQADLAFAMEPEIYDRTMIKYRNTTNGLLNTLSMGRHITDWMPAGSESDQTVQLGEFTASPHMSVSNGFGAQGLALLGEMTKNTTYTALAKALSDAITKYMWNGNTQFCDGICSQVKNHSLVMTNMFFLTFDLISASKQDAIDAAWKTTTDWGIENIGDYGAFWYMSAVAGSYYHGNGKMYATPKSDDGSAMLHALTKCDKDSWCSGLKENNLTMTRESWHDGTYSHQWGTAPIVGVVWGLLGIHQTAPGFSTVTISPKIGNLTSISGKVPSIRGFISVSVPTHGTVDLAVPCGVAATVCLPRSAHDPVGLYTSATHHLTLDGRNVDAVDAPSGHLCAEKPIGCATRGSVRRLRAVEKTT